MIKLKLFSLCCIYIYYFSLVGAENEHRKCYKRFGNCDILCPDPYNKIWRVPDEKTCVDFCAADKAMCLGLVYEKPYLVCNLYNVSLDSPNVVLAPAFRKIYYSLNNTGCIAGYTGTAPILTTTIYVPKGTVSVTQASTTLVQGDTLPTDTTTTTIAGATPGATTPRSGTTPVVIAGGASSCPSGTQSAFVGFGGQGLSGATPVATANGISDPTACITACSSNKDPSGKDMQCQSFTFDAAASACTFYNEKPKPDGKGTFVSAATQNVLMKVCLPATPATANCKDALLPANMENILKGHVKKDIASGIGTSADCLGRCVTETSFQCQSANYIPSKGQCQLNDANSNTASSDFVKAPSDGSTYLENTCIGRRVFKKELLALLKESKDLSSEIQEEEEIPVLEPWTEWTSCIKEGDEQPVRVRIRMCTGGTLKCEGKKVDHQFCL